MSIYNNRNNQQEMVALLEWSTTMKRSPHSPNELVNLRKRDPMPETGYVYYNYHGDTYG